MMRVLILAFILITCCQAIPRYLKCYECTMNNENEQDCGDPFTASAKQKYITTCQKSMDVCVKSRLPEKGFVGRSCMDERSAEKWVEDRETEYERSYCKTDRCNCVAEYGLMNLLLIIPMIIMM